MIEYISNGMPTWAYVFIGIAVKDRAGDLMPSIIMPDLNMNLSRALKFIVGYCNKHPRCQDGCRLWDDEAPRCILRNDMPPCDWEPIIKAVKEQEVE